MSRPTDARLWVHSATGRWMIDEVQEEDLVEGPARLVAVDQRDLLQLRELGARVADHHEDLRAQVARLEAQRDAIEERLAEAQAALEGAILGQHANSRMVELSVLSAWAGALGLDPEARWTCEQLEGATRLLRLADVPHVG
jgi:outer membrane protein TolC